MSSRSRSRLRLIRSGQLAGTTDLRAALAAAKRHRRTARPALSKHRRTLRLGVDIDEGWSCAAVFRRRRRREVYQELTGLAPARRGGQRAALRQSWRPLPLSQCPRLRRFPQRRPAQRARQTASVLNMGACDAHTKSRMTRVSCECRRYNGKLESWYCSVSRNLADTATADECEARSAGDVHG